MKANVLHRIGDLRFQDIPQPKPAAREVIVAVRAAGICGSDITRVYTTGTRTFPRIIGHEFSGEIVAVGKRVNPRLVAARVAIFPLIPCKHCSQCRRKCYEMCSEYDYLGSRRDGGFAEYVAVPVWNVMRIPKGVSYEEAAMFEPAAVAVHALKISGFKAGDSIAIFGVGSIGLMLAQIAWAKQAGKIMLITRNSKKMNFARQLGFSSVFNSHVGEVRQWILSQTKGIGADIVIEGTGTGSVMDACLEVAKHAGTIVVLGNPADDVCIRRESYSKLLRKQLSVFGTWNSSFKARNSDWDQAVKLLTTGRLDLRSLITHRFSLAELHKGLRTSAKVGIFSIKVMILNE